MRVLAIDDEQAIREMLSFSLEKQGVTLFEAADCSQASRILQQESIDLILLDWMLPDQSGIEFTQQLRKDKASKNIPIIMLTAKAEESNKLRGLEEAQVDDYVTKPFSPRELFARMKTVLQRSNKNAAQDYFDFNELHLDYKTRQLFIQKEVVEITAKQFNLLHFFLGHQDKVFTRQQLLDALAKGNDFHDERSIDRQVKRLRDVLQPFGYHDYVHTIRGHGYKFTSQL